MYSLFAGPEKVKPHHFSPPSSLLSFSHPPLFSLFSLFSSHLSRLLPSSHSHLSQWVPLQTVRSLLSFSPPSPLVRVIPIRLREFFFLFFPSSRIEGELPLIEAALSFYFPSVHMLIINLCFTATRSPMPSSMPAWRRTPSLRSLVRPPPRLVGSIAIRLTCMN